MGCNQFILLWLLPKKNNKDEVKLFVVGPYCLEWLRYSTAKIYANKVCSSFGEFRIKTQTIHCIYCPYLCIIAHSIVDELIVCVGISVYVCLYQCISVLYSFLFFFFKKKCVETPYQKIQQSQLPPPPPPPPSAPILFHVAQFLL